MAEGRSSRSRSYNTLRRRVQRHPRSQILISVGALNAELHRVHTLSKPSPFPDVINPFTLAGVARTALIGGQDGGGRTVLFRDMIEMCELHGDIMMPSLMLKPGTDRLRKTLALFAYEQFAHQASIMENVGRTVALFLEDGRAIAGFPDPSDWEALLGASIESYMRLGFSLHVLAVENDGLIRRDALAAPGMAPVTAPLEPDEALAVVNQWFAATPSELAALGTISQVRRWEKWSLNPLAVKPLVALSSEFYVVPWPRLVLDRITPTSFYFIGLEAFGSSFTDSLGKGFERYVGRQLATLTNATIVPEIVYGKTGERTVDYFIVTPEAVVLVEVKTARPIEAARLGQDDGEKDLVAKIGRAFKQINVSAALIQSNHPALESIPNDRPLVGLVVTLEPFYLINSELFSTSLPRTIVPVAVASAHDLEGFVARAMNDPHIGRRLVGAIDSEPTMGPVLRPAVDDLPAKANVILDEAWTHFTATWHEPE